MENDSQAAFLLEHLEGDVAHFEGDARLTVIPAADRENLAADLPDV